MAHHFKRLKEESRPGRLSSDGKHAKMDSNGGSWQQSGGLLQPPWLFRRKASPTGGAKKNTTQPGGVFFAIIDAFASMIYDHQSVALPTERGEGGRERPDRRRGRKQGGERVAAVGVQRRRTKTIATFGHRKSRLSHGRALSFLYKPFN